MRGIGRRTAVQAARASRADSGLGDGGMKAPGVSRRAMRLGRLGVLLAVAIPGFLISASAANAASFTVNDANDAALANPAGTTCASTDGGGCTLRAAVQAADNAGGASTITVPGGDFKLTIAATAGGGADDPSTGDLDVRTGVALTIAGSGASSTIIDATHTDRAFAVHTGASLAIAGVTIENGSQPDSAPSSDSVSAGYGGAFYNDGSLSVNASVISNNSALNGGGVVFSDTAASATSITNSTLTGNSASDQGGVVYAESGSVTFANDTVTHNSADYEGGVLYGDDSGNTVGAVTVAGSTLSNNVAESDGGAIYVDDVGALTVSGSSLDNDSTSDSDGGALEDDNSAPLTVSASTFSGDIAGDGDGGAIYTDGADLSAGGVSGSTFTGDAGDAGGAIYVAGSSATAAQLITTSTFANNDATDDEGGAIYDDEGDLTLTRSTFNGNSSAYYGGALAYESGDGLAVINDTVDGNQAIEGGAIYLNSVASTGTLVFLNDTITRNTGYYGGGVAYPGDANTIENTIVADNSGGIGSDGGGDCYGSVATDNAAGADAGGNIDSDGTCFSDAVRNDHTGVNPDVGVPAENGGAMETDALLSGSPAIADAIGAACPTIDERGVARPAACDSGAFQTATADVGVTVSAPVAALIGWPVTETFSVGNNGPGPATGVTVSDTLPPGTSYFSSIASQGTCAGTSTVTCSLGTLDSSATGATTSATITIVLIPSRGGSFTNTGAVSDSQVDPNQANNTASATTDVAFPILTPSLVSLTLKSHHKKHRYTFAGTLTLPSGMNSAVSCDGTVNIKVMHGAKLLSTHHAKVSHTCTYSKRITVHGSQRRKIVATFTGNATLTHTSHTIHIR
jgi:uncharacterized repeat protein (TIGR01451 family)